ncbi:hypothetical protein FB451DRAFT_1171712 [Mycena latifolia]|nr:hypothetical protein FB451DRAFT_1171712 [Mycena latifolia]
MLSVRLLTYVVNSCTDSAPQDYIRSFSYAAIAPAVLVPRAWGVPIALVQLDRFPTAAAHDLGGLHDARPRVSLQGRLAFHLVIATFLYVLALWLAGGHAGRRGAGWGDGMASSEEFAVAVAIVHRLVVRLRVVCLALRLAGLRRLPVHDGTIPGSVNFVAAQRAQRRAPTQYGRRWAARGQAVAAARLGPARATAAIRCRISPTDQLARASAHAPKVTADAVRLVCLHQRGQGLERVGALVPKDVGASAAPAHVFEGQEALFGGRCSAGHGEEVRRIFFAGGEEGRGIRVGGLKRIEPHVFWVLLPRPCVKRPGIVLERRCKSKSKETTNLKISRLWDNI